MIKNIPKIVVLFCLMIFFNGCQKPKWEKVSGVVLAEAKAGDLVRVSAPDGMLEIKLYFADAPEVSTPEREGEMAACFGIPGNTVPIFAEEARKLVVGILGSGTFSFWTKWEKAPTSEKEIPRYYGFITFSDPVIGVRQMSEALVRAGYAVPFGKSSSLPNGTPAGDYFQFLEKNCEAARNERRGIWRLSTLKQ